MDQVESAVLNSTADWRDLVDELGFIDYFLATELTRNPDGYRGSVYMHKVGSAPPKAILHACCNQQYLSQTGAIGLEASQGL